jgi:excisionase family DNA binding protein
MTGSHVQDFIPSKEDAILAGKALESLSKLVEGQRMPGMIPFASLSKFKELVMPIGIFELILELLNQAAQGHSVTIIPSNKEFTTQEAADLLNVSRPFVIKLLEDGKIPFHKVGAHRRIKARDLMTYRRESEKESLEAFQELAKLSQKMGLGYK